ncbi:leucine-rich repeat-containing protein 42 isoform X2 [Carettochelys insculpta]|uniref:leucine-rich repeat-containing protein 42 isoform X2 n=1 Tax=Carettochelys insculpta TaxID=44489 RepID=UPI003EBC71F8
MSYSLKSENLLDRGPIYVREHGQLYTVDQDSSIVNNSTPEPRPFRLFSKGFSVELCMNREDDSARKERTDHFIFTYTKEGNLRYSAKSLFGLVLDYISDNVDHIDSLIGFPEQIAEKLFSAAEARQKFKEPVTGLRALQKFTEAYGSLVLCSLCLQNSVTRLLLKDNCLSDAGLRKMTAPVRVMKRGLENLCVLDLSCNPEITDRGIGYLFSFKKLNYLDISKTGLKDVKAVVQRLQTQISLVHSKVPLKEFDHSNCKTEGWAEQTVLQWEQLAMKTVRTKETLKSRTAAQHFYGKKCRIEEPVTCTLVQTNAKASENLQFYKDEEQNSHFPILKKEAAASHHLKKTKGLTEQEREPTSKQKHTCLTMEDWDLLDTY